MTPWRIALAGATRVRVLRVGVLLLGASTIALGGCTQTDDGSSQRGLASDCAPGYSPCVPNVAYDLDCKDIGFSVEVTGADPYGFDGDGDGYGCETW